MSAGHTVPHTRILAGLVLGAVVGCLANAMFAETKARHSGKTLGFTEKHSVIQTPSGAELKTEKQSATLTINGTDIKLSAENAANQPALVKAINQSAGKTDVAASIDPGTGETVLTSTVWTKGDFHVTASGPDAANVKPLEVSTSNAAWFGWVVRNLADPVGKVFLNLLFMAIIPLVFASITVGVTRLGGGENVGRIGLKTITYFLVTTACAAAIGLTLVNAIKPGNQIPPEKKEELLSQYSTEAGDKIKKKEGDEAFGINTFVKIVPRYPLKALVENDMLAVIFTAIIVGIALTRMQPDRAKLMVELLEGVNFIADFILRLAMTIAPYAVFCLIFSTTAALGYKVLVALGAFIGTVLGGLAIHLCVVLPLLVKFLGGMSPVKFFQRARGTMVTAFSTSSSSATLPTAMKCAEEELGVPPTVSRFVLPLSASMNHNGTALFESVTVLFLAQAFGVELDLGQQLVVLVLCILTATGMAGVPGGSLPLIGLILVQVNVPAGAIALVLGVDRILDMCRTMVNVTADLTTAVFVARSEPGVESAPAALAKDIPPEHVSTKLAEQHSEKEPDRPR